MRALTRRIFAVLLSLAVGLAAGEAMAQRYAPDGSVMPDPVTRPEDSNAPPVQGPDSSSNPPVLGPDSSVNPPVSGPDSSVNPPVLGPDQSQDAPVLSPDTVQLDSARPAD
jgi:hypothetical protein